MPQEDVDAAIQRATEEINRDTNDVGGSSAPGKLAFENIQADPNLTPAERQLVFRAVAAVGVQTEIARTPTGGTLMRLNSPTTGFIASYMGTYARDFNNAMVQSSLREAARTTLPKALYDDGVTFGNAIGKVEAAPGRPPISIETQAALDLATVDMSKRMNQAAMQNLSKLSGDAQLFIQSALEPAQGTYDRGTLTTVASNILFLRSMNSVVIDAVTSVRTDPQLQPEAALIMFSNIVGNTYYNGVHHEAGLLKQQEKPQDPLASQMRDPATLNQTEDAYNALALGGDSLQNFFHRMELKRDNAPLERLQQRRFEQMSQALNRPKQQQVNKEKVSPAPIEQRDKKEKDKKEKVSAPSKLQPSKREKEKVVAPPELQPSKKDKVNAPSKLRPITKVKASQNSTEPREKKSAKVRDFLGKGVEGTSAPKMSFDVAKSSAPGPSRPINPIRPLQEKVISEPEKISFNMASDAAPARPRKAPSGVKDIEPPLIVRSPNAPLETGLERVMERKFSAGEVKPIETQTGPPPPTIDSEAGIRGLTNLTGRITGPTPPKIPLNRPAPKPPVGQVDHSTGAVAHIPKKEDRKPELGGRKLSSSNLAKF